VNGEVGRLAAEVPRAARSPSAFSGEAPVRGWGVEDQPQEDRFAVAIGLSRDGARDALNELPEQLDTRARAGLAQDVFLVKLDRPRADPEPDGDIVETATQAQ